ncbi:Putative pectate lyase E [Verticillium dahliae VDG1]|nr:Putative pectate lyase E [Verticillium dahliae VDG1]
MSCPDCFSGALHKGIPRGRVTTLHGLDVYMTEPQNQQPAKGIIVVIPDVFGWEFPNARLIADRYADKGGYKVYLPDFMDGHAAPVSVLANMRAIFGDANLLSKAHHLISALLVVVPFFYRNRFGITHPRVKTFFAAVRADEPALSLGAVGFCWGGKHTKLVVPLSIAVGSEDNQIPTAKAERVRPVIEARNGEIVVYDGSTHGFALRASFPKDEKVDGPGEEAEDQCIAWFRKHFRAT